MVSPGRHFRLSEGQESLGPSWSDNGLALAGVALFRRTSDGFAPRPVEQLEALLKAAYDRDLDPATVRGLTVAAESLNRGDTARATIAALHLRLPTLSRDRALKIGQVDDDIAKYNQDQPRDWHGRWTDEDVARPALAAPRTAHDFQSDGDADGEPPPAMGGNLPPPDPQAEPPEDPAFPAEKVPDGWDKPGYWEKGQYHQPTRLPVLLNGMPWPEATVNVIKGTLRPQPGRPQPYMVIFVPRDGKGPPLVGSGPNGDYLKPPGYDEVRFTGTPQETNSGGAPTRHADASVEEALRMAESNKFSEIFFNRSYSTIRPGMFESMLRTDVVGVMRPELNDPFTLEPYEVFSPRQKREIREQQLAPLPGLRPLRG